MCILVQNLYNCNDFKCKCIYNYERKKNGQKAGDCSVEGNRCRFFIIKVPATS